MSLLPPAVAIVKQEHPTLRVAVQIETSDVLIERLAQGRLDMVVGRLFERHDKTDLRYEALVEEPVCVVARPGHPLARMARLTLRDIVGCGWIVPSQVPRRSTVEGCVGGEPQAHSTVSTAAAAVSALAARTM